MVYFVRGPYLSDTGLRAAESYQGYRWDAGTVRRSVRVSEELSGCEKIIFDRIVNMLRSRSPDFENTQELVDLINGFRREQTPPDDSSHTSPTYSNGNNGANNRTNTNTADNQVNNDDWNRRMKEIDARTKESLDRIYKQAQADFERRKQEQEAAQNIRRGGTGATENK